MKASDASSSVGSEPSPKPAYRSPQPEAKGQASSQPRVMEEEEAGREEEGGASSTMQLFQVRHCCCCC